MQSNQNTMGGRNDISVLDDLKCAILKVVRLIHNKINYSYDFILSTTKIADQYIIQPNIMEEKYLHEPMRICTYLEHQILI